MAQNSLNTTLLEQLTRLDDCINGDEANCIRARWEYGRRIAVFYELKPFGERKQLPNGVLKQLASERGVHQSEVSARMKFARMCGTEEALSTLLERSTSWFDIKQHKLSEATRTTKTTKTPLRRAFDLIDTHTPELGDLALIRRIRQSLDSLEERLKLAKVAA